MTNKPEAPVPVEDRFPEDDLRYVRNRTFAEIAIGDRACIERCLTASDVQLFAVIMLRRRKQL